MKIRLKIEKEFDVKYLAVTAGIRHPESVIVDDVECGELSEIPCHDGKHWQVMIDVDTGVITNWPKGVTADICAKVCDDGIYSILDENKQELKRLVHCYVPDCLAINDNGYGDYIIMEIDADGKIKDWNPSFDEFEQEDDE